MKEREVLKLALEALEEIAWSNSTDWQRDRAKVAITAIKEALAQPEQEPMAYSYTSRITGAQGFSHHPMPRFIDSESWDIKPLYTTPPPLKPLLVGKESAEFAEWFNAYWIGDGEQGETIPTKGKEYDEYLSQYTLAFGAWMAAKQAAHGIKEKNT